MSGVRNHLTVYTYVTYAPSIHAKFDRLAECHTRERDDKFGVIIGDPGQKFPPTFEKTMSMYTTSPCTLTRHMCVRTYVCGFLESCEGSDVSWTVEHLLRCAVMSRVYEGVRAGVCEKIRTRRQMGISGRLCWSLRRLQRTSPYSTVYAGVSHGQVSSRLRTECGGSEWPADQRLQLQGQQLFLAPEFQSHNW